MVCESPCRTGGSVVWSSSSNQVTTVPCPWLDGKHTVFGRVLQGMDVAGALEGSGGPEWALWLKFANETCEHSFLEVDSSGMTTVITFDALLVVWMEKTEHRMPPHRLDDRWA